MPHFQETNTMQNEETKRIKDERNFGQQPVSDHELQTKWYGFNGKKIKINHIQIEQINGCLNKCFSFPFLVVFTGKTITYY